MYNLTADECAKWYKNKSKHPKTGEKLNYGTNEYHHVHESCARGNREQILNKCKINTVLSQSDCQDLYRNRFLERDGKYLKYPDQKFLRYACFCSEMYDLKIPKLNIAKYIASKTGAAVTSLMRHLKSSLINIIYYIGNFHKKKKNPALTLHECLKWRKTGKHPRTNEIINNKHPNFREYSERCRKIISKHVMY